ncbi:MAG: hypothetical protein DCC75_00535 [Proteobacteria bacterium]|nr:MAG: hypothetical protein DCC75_00535 [Pseudomonadota bacterium]
MRRRPHLPDEPAVHFQSSSLNPESKIGLVLSGGGARAAYQVGALRAVAPYITETSQEISTIIGSSVGAINGLIASASLKHGLLNAVDQLQDLWVERTFRNTFSGSPSRAFFRAIKVAALQYMSPGPNATSDAVFDPTPLMHRVDKAIQDNGGLKLEERIPSLENVAVMTTIEGPQRKPLLFLSSHKRLSEEELLGASFDICYVTSLSAKHGLASAALPSILPPVELDADVGKVRLVDGGISQNVPVDPAVRLGAERVIVIDISGRNWWLARYGEKEDTRPTWEVPAALKTFCLRPPETFVIRPRKPLGPLLREAVGSSTTKFISAVGPVWPLYTLLKNKLGEEVAYEVMSYAALDRDYLVALIERGFNETSSTLRNKRIIEYSRSDNYQQWAQAL